MVVINRNQFFTFQISTSVRHFVMLHVIIMFYSETCYCICLCLVEVLELP